MQKSAIARKPSDGSARTQKQAFPVPTPHLAHTVWLSTEVGPPVWRCSNHFESASVIRCHAQSCRRKNRERTLLSTCWSRWVFVMRASGCGSLAASTNLKSIGKLKRASGNLAGKLNNLKDVEIAFDIGFDVASTSLRFFLSVSTAPVNQTPSRLSG